MSIQFAKVLCTAHNPSCTMVATPTRAEFKLPETNIRLLYTNLSTKPADTAGQAPHQAIVYTDTLQPVTSATIRHPDVSAGIRAAGKKIKNNAGGLHSKLWVPILQPIMPSLSILNAKGKPRKLKTSKKGRILLVSAEYRASLQSGE